MNEFIIIEKDGKEIECEVLCSFDCAENGKSYILCTDHSLNEKQEENIYAYSYIPNSNYENLRMVTTDIEKELINDVISQIKKM